MTTRPPFAEDLRRTDNDRFLTALFAPATRRDGLLALYAFNAELARIREQVREPMMGMIRLQWWRDEIAKLYEGKGDGRHAMLAALASAIVRSKLPQALFQTLINAREADLSATPHATQDAFLAYAAQTSAPLGEAAARLLGATEEPSLQAARQTAEAYALSGLLRAVPFLAAQQQTMLPLDVLQRHSLTPDMLFQAQPPDRLPLAIKDLSILAEEKRRVAKAQQDTLPRATRRALLPVLMWNDLAALYLRTLRAQAHDVFAPRVTMRHPLRGAVLLWRAVKP